MAGKPRSTEQVKREKRAASVQLEFWEISDEERAETRAKLAEIKAKLKRV